MRLAPSKFQDVVIVPFLKPFRVDCGLCIPERWHIMTTVLCTKTVQTHFLDLKRCNVSRVSAARVQ